jgi:hypothetical protein
MAEINPEEMNRMTEAETASEKHRQKTVFIRMKLKRP